MATITFFKSATPDGGAKGDQLTDGGVDDLLPEITSQNRLNGVEFFRKIWYESDADVTCMASLANEGNYNACFFKSANDADTVADLTGNEDMYGALKIVSNTVNTVKVTNDADGWTLARVNDHGYIGNDVVKVDTITDNGDGTSTFNFSPDVADVDHTGEYFDTLISVNMTATTAVPFWCKVKVPALAPLNSTYNTLQFLSIY